jgi:hypothetical protein
MKRATVLLLALLLVLAAGADAKFSSARVCGPSDCREVTLAAGQTVVTMMEAALSTPPGLSSKPPEASAWYRVTLCPGACDSRHAVTLKVLPATGYEYLAPHEQFAQAGWAKLDDPAADVYRRVTKNLEPFPASGLIALGAEEPDSPGQEGIPAWAWVAMAAAPAVLGFVSLGWFQRSRSAAVR